MHKGGDKTQTTTDDDADEQHRVPILRTSSQQPGVKQQRKKDNQDELDDKHLHCAGVVKTNGAKEEDGGSVNHSVQRFKTHNRWGQHKVVRQPIENNSA